MTGKVGLWNRNGALGRTWAATTPLSSAKSALRLPQLEISQQGCPSPSLTPTSPPSVSNQTCNHSGNPTAWVLARGLRCHDSGLDAPPATTRDSLRGSGRRRRRRALAHARHQGAAAPYLREPPTRLSVTPDVLPAEGDAGPSSSLDRAPEERVRRERPTTRGATYPPSPQRAQRGRVCDEAGWRGALHIPAGNTSATHCRACGRRSFSFERTLFFERHGPVIPLRKEVLLQFDAQACS